MKRIAADDVDRAYAKTGLIPSRGDEQWFAVDGKSGCAATALVRARIADFCNSNWPFELVARAIDVAPLYLRGFIRGFDGHESTGAGPTDSISASQYTLGHADGKAAADRVFGPSRMDGGTT